MSKRGQVTIFIVVGILILGAVAGMIYLSQYTAKKELTITSDKLDLKAAPVKLYVENCLKKTTEKALVKIGRQGGYNQVPDKSIMVLDERTPLYYLNFKKNIPTKKKIAQEISIYVNQNLNNCLNNLSTFKQQQYTFDLQPLKVVAEVSEVIKKITVPYWEAKTQIQDSKVVVNLDFPLTIKKGDQKTRISKFQSDLPVRLGTVYSTATKMVEDYSQKPDYICLTCLKKIWDGNIKVNVVPQKDVLWFLITDNKSQIDNQDYFYKFVVEFLVQEPAKNKVIIQPIGPLQALVGKSFEYKVKASGQKLTFSDDSELFDIDKLKGIISFVPTKEKVGKNIVEITATDNQGNQDSEFILLDIKSRTKDPIIDYIGLQQAFAKTPFTYEVKVTNLDKSQVKFSDNTELFDISEQGLINFTPLASGTYSIDITAAGKAGGQDKTKMELVVT